MCPNLSTKFLRHFKVNYFSDFLEAVPDIKVIVLWGKFVKFND
jgi:hypothetical protein